ncbi:MAG: ribonuclease R [Clostridia bacterium]|nr:ribonuclease R [Clostridia bacterium]
MNRINAEKLLAALAASKKSMSAADALAASGLDDLAQVNDLAREMEQEGLLWITPMGNLLTPEKGRLTAATIVSQSEHFCFARPKDGSPDLFIPEERLNGAMLGDFVFVCDREEGAKGPSGAIRAIIRPGTHCFTGRHAVGKDGVTGFVCDAPLRYTIPLQSGGEVPMGEKVRVSVQRDKFGSLYAEVLQMYGSADSARICADAVLDGHNIPTVFPQEVLDAAAALEEGGIPAEELARRLDLRDEMIFTIDSAEAKDLDDAISLRATENGWHLGVHIADVSHYVRHGSVIDMEARKRGTSVYFADRVVPMLPEAISNGVCSLNAGTDKLAFSALMELDHNGNIVDYEFRKTVIHSKVRGVYAEVNEIFAGTASEEILAKYAPVMDALTEAKKLASVMRHAAHERGYMELDSVESKFIMDENGVCIDMMPRTTGEAEQLIEQMMVTANQAAAKLGKAKKLPFIYRVHEEPSAERLANLQELAVRLGFDARKLEPGVRQQDLSELLDKARETKYSRIISFQMLRTMAKARYDTSPIGHYGLALEDYSHFTSPIRRYSDTSIHRILSAYVDGMTPADIRREYYEFADEAAALSSDTEVRAMTAERDTEDRYAAEYLRAHVGECYHGTVNGVTEWGIYVQLDNTAEGFVSALMFPRNFCFDGLLSYSGGGKEPLTVGDSMEIRVVKADVASGMVDFEPADRPPNTPVEPRFPARGGHRPGGDHGGDKKPKNTYPKSDRSPSEGGFHKNKRSDNKHHNTRKRGR